MAANGFNAVRTYTMPPTWLLDLAAEEGLYVAISPAAERSVGYLNERGGGSVAEKAARDVVRRYAGHPAVLCYSLGNEIPASVVRWLGARQVERFLERLFDIAKARRTRRGSSPTPTSRRPSTSTCRSSTSSRSTSTSSSPIRLAAVPAPEPRRRTSRLLLAELGMDSAAPRRGEQARRSWQVRTAVRCGLAGAFVFSWTDDWHTGGHQT